MTGGAEDGLAALMGAAQAGDARAYAALLHAAMPHAAAVARRQGVPADRVDDVVQDVLLTIHRARATYDPARPFLPWLRAIAERRAIDHLRALRRSVGREVADEAVLAGLPDPAAETASGAEAGERVRAVGEALAALTPGQREAVEQLAVQGRSLSEAAAATGRSKGALKVNLHRALKAIRARLGEGGERG